MADYRLRRRALTREALSRVREGVLGSPLVGASTLGGSFQASRGFAITFTGAGVDPLLARFGFLAPFWRVARAPAPEAQLVPWPRRWWSAPPPPPNAFFLNLLALGPGAEVERHVDVTLQEPSGDRTAAPVVVSVLYLEVPRGSSGGRLILDEDRQPRGAVRPRPGMLVHFAGHLAHRVEAFEAPGPTPLRASLVLEQYRLAPEALARLPAFQIQSRAGFSAFLEDHRRREQEGGALRPSRALGMQLEP